MTIWKGAASQRLKTGQVTQYGSEPDDGYYQRGADPAYTILAAGQYSGNANIDLAHYSGQTGIAFAATTPGTITDTANGLANFLTGDTIVISGSGLNNGVYTVSTGGVAGTIRTTEATVLEGAGASITIAKREVHANACVRDERTGLMWSRTGSSKVGAASDGLMPWSGADYDIFAYCAAANAALVGGHDDWRIPNIFELYSLVNMEQPSGAPDTTAFPAWPVTEWVWASTTRPDATTLRKMLAYPAADILAETGTDHYHFAVLVRGA